LRLNRAKITEKGLDEIAKMTDLEGLYLEETGIGDDNLVQLQGLDNLRTLVISGNNRITDKAFAILGELKSLEWLEIARTPVSGAGMLDGKKSKLSKLKHLSVAFTNLGDQGMLAIQKMNSLEYLDVGDTNVNDTNLQGVKPHKDLQHIYLHQLDKLSSNGLKNLSSLKELRTIYLDRSRGVGDPGLAHLKGLKKLERLVITETNCTEEGAQTLKKFLPDLKITLKRGKPDL
jgi:hypothetical protein